MSCSDGRLLVGILVSFKWDPSQWKTRSLLMLAICRKRTVTTIAANQCYEAAGQVWRQAGEID